MAKRSKLVTAASKPTVLIPLRGRALENAISEDYGECRLLATALEAEEVLRQSPPLTVTQVQIQRGCSRLCLYGVPTNHDDVRLINFGVTGIGNWTIQFRYPEFVPDDLPFPVGLMNNSGWLYVLMHQVGPDTVLPVIKMYLANVMPAVVDHRVKRGSSPERVMRRLLKEIFPNVAWIENHSHPDLTDEIGRPLRLDFRSKNEQLNLAIEVDGKQHVDRVSAWHDEPKFIAAQERDRQKEAACRKLGIGFVRIPAYGANCDLFRLAGKERRDWLLGEIERQIGQRLI